MTTNNVRSFADLADLRDKIVPNSHRSTSNVQKKAHQVKKEPSMMKPQMEAREVPQLVTPRPTFQPKVPLSETIADLNVFISTVLNTTKYGFIYDMAPYTIHALMASVRRRIPTLNKASLAIQTLDGIAAYCVSSSRNGITATSMGSILEQLQSVPGVTDESGPMIRIVEKKGELTFEEVHRTRDASSALDVLKTYGTIFTEDTIPLLKKLDSAKCTPAGSLFVAELKDIRKNVPDAGICFLNAVFEIVGTDRRNYPALDLSRAKVSTLQWIKATLRDFRRYIEVQDTIFHRAALFMPWIDQEITAADVQKLAASISNSTEISATQAKILASAEALVDVQDHCLQCVDNLLAYINFKLSEKDWYRKNNNLRKGVVETPKENATKRLEALPRSNGVTTPKQAAQLRPVRAAMKPSQNTPDEAVASLKAEGVEVDVDIQVPRFNSDILNVTEASRKKVLKAATLDGVRECQIYPGVLWEAIIGPIDHALDVERTETDLRTVIIAPRRKDGLGLDITAARMLMVEEYESYFTPVEM